MQMMSAIFLPEGHTALKNFYVQVKQVLQPYLTGRVYMNFLEGEEAQAQIKNGFAPEAYERLAKLKAKCDPENVLGYSFNILPQEITAQFAGDSISRDLM